MVLNKLEIGIRIRKIREDIYHESRQLFAERCGLSESYLCKLENGSTLMSVKTLNNICTYAGADADYILYGESKIRKLSTRRTINKILDRFSKKKLQASLKFLSILDTFKDE